jgi:ubiquinone/menaquinone biosynthesis C-methylase UbiE
MDRAASKFDPARLERLLSEERRRMLDPERYLDLLPLREDMLVADVGCGPGFFTLPLAQRLRRGHVLACDIQPEMVEAARRRSVEAGLTNIEFQLSTEDRAPLPPEGVDGILLNFVLHEVARPRAFLEMLRRGTKPGGFLALAEWHKRETGQGPAVRERLTPEETRALLQEAGWTVQDTRDLNEAQYLVLALNKLTPAEV